MGKHGECMRERRGVMLENAWGRIQMMSDT
jgi:hypothetical protein